MCYGQVNTWIMCFDEMQCSCLTTYSACGFKSRITLSFFGHNYRSSRKIYLYKIQGNTYFNRKFIYNRLEDTIQKFLYLQARLLSLKISNYIDVYRQLILT